jgi:hypothetical protein
MKTHTCAHPDPKSAMKSELDEMDRIRALPRGKLVRQQFLGKACLLILIVAVAVGVIGGFKGSGVILVASAGVAFAAVAILTISHRISRCPDCRSALVYHESFCNLATGKQDDRILLECTTCGKAWDAGAAPSHEPTPP